MNVLEEGKLYYRSDLERYLKSLGLPCSYPTIIRYEKDGIIPSPRSTMKNRYRVYTAQDIVGIAEKIKKLLHP